MSDYRRHLAELEARVEARVYARIAKEVRDYASNIYVDYYGDTRAAERDASIKEHLLQLADGIAELPRA